MLGGVKGGFESVYKDCTGPGQGLSDCQILRRFLPCDFGPRRGLFRYATLGAEIHREVHLLVPAVPHQDRSACQAGWCHGHTFHLPPPRSRAVPLRSFVPQKANALPGRAPPGRRLDMMCTNDVPEVGEELSLPRFHGPVPSVVKYRQPRRICQDRRDDLPGVRSGWRRPCSSGPATSGCSAPPFCSPSMMERI